MGYRLYTVFMSTSLAISKQTIIIFSVFYVFTFIAMIPATWVIARFRITGEDKDGLLPLGIMGFNCILILNVSLIGMFIRKLVQVYQCIEQHGEKLIQLITKTSLL